MPKFCRLSAALLLAAATLGIPTTAAPSLTKIRWRYTVETILNDLFTNYFPTCDIILMQDTFFSKNMNYWVRNLRFPYYSITLDGKRFPDYTTWQKITKTTGFPCSTIVAVCASFETCRNKDSPTLFKMLSANGILLKERRAILYIDKYSDQDDVPYSLSNSPDKWAITHEHHEGQNYSLTVLKKAKYILHELKSHITIIRDVTRNLQERSTRHSLRRTLNHLESADPENFDHDILYETLTFSPNWIPGGTPLIPNLWSKNRGFSLPHLPVLKLTNMKPGGVVKFCLSSKSLLPFIDVAKDGSITGFDAEIVHLFRRHLKIKAEFYEPSDRAYGMKDKNGNWSGAIGFVIRKEADIGLGQVIFTHDKKESGLKFSPLVATLEAVAMCPTPKLLPRYQILAYPFDNATWVYLVVSFMSSIVIIEVLQRVAIRLMPMQILVQGKTMSKMGNVWQSKLPWIQSIGPIFQRSIPVNLLPRRWAILGLFSIWLIFTFITVAAYVTLLIGALSVPPREPYVHSPADLVNTKKEWAVSSLVEEAIEHSTVSSEIKLLKGAKRITDLPEYKDVPADIQVCSYVNATGNCGVTEEFRSKFYIGSKFNVIKNKHKQQLMYISEGSFFIGATGWVMRDDMDFTLETYFDNIFLDVVCYGLHDKIIDDLLPEQLKIQNPIEPLNLETVQVVFVFGFFGLLASCFVFVVEIIVFRFRAGVSVVRIRFLQRDLDTELFPFTL